MRIVVTDDLQRSRLTVFFRVFLAIPHYIWALLIGTAVGVCVFVNWFILLIKGRTPDALHDFIAGYVRYLAHLEAYFLLAANPFPSFYLIGKPTYPVERTLLTTGLVDALLESKLKNQQRVETPELGVKYALS